MSASFRNQPVEYPTRENGSEKAKVIHDRQKPRYYGKKKAILLTYHSGIGKFFASKAKARKIQSENVQLKWELRISNLLG